MNSATAIQTYTGIFFDPFNPDPDLIRIEDIAHALTMQCRFSGHVRKRWSVAQHSLFVSDHCPEGFKLEGLLHDAAEAYLVDLPRPIKRATGFVTYRALEDRVAQAILDRFDLIAFEFDEVKRADNLLLWAEAEALLRGTKDWLADRPEGVDSLYFSQVVGAIRSANPPSDLYIEEEFLRTFYALGGK